MRIALSSLVFTTTILVLSSAVNAAQILERHATADVTLTDDGGTPKRILRVTVPAGGWIVHTKAIAVNPGHRDIVRCSILQTAGGDEWGAPDIGALGRAS